MEMLAEDFYTGLCYQSYDSNLETNLPTQTLEEWERETDVEYPRLSNRSLICRNCINYGLWRSCGGASQLGIQADVADDDNYICIIPCNRCARSRNYYWGKSYSYDEDGDLQSREIPCNGILPGTNRELTVHELVLYEINVMYEQLLIARRFQPIQNSTNILFKILDEILFRKSWRQNIDLNTEFRYDIHKYTRFLKGEWLSLRDTNTNVPLYTNTADYGDDVNGELLRFNMYFKEEALVNELYIRFLESSYIETTPIPPIITNVIYNEITNLRYENDGNDDNDDKANLCKKGTEILDNIFYDEREKKGTMNEYEYKNLMDIFLQLHNDL